MNVLQSLWPVAIFVFVCPASAGKASVNDSRPLPLEVSNPVLQEPVVQAYYRWLENYTEVPLKSFNVKSVPAVVRVTNLDDDEFQQLVRDGSPFVVDDCTRGFDLDAISHFECKDFAERWPSGNMRAEYTPGQKHIYLKDPTWYTKIEPQRGHTEHMAGKQKIAGPYIWHVKDEEPLETKREVQRFWRTPYFLERSIANRMEANESFEFWFSLAGGGTFAHADAYCESTISMQFRGNKRWRIQAFPRVQHYLNATGFADGKIYDGKQHAPWTPEAEVTVGPGQCMVFPTGYLHETYVDPSDNDEGCYTASTFQFNHPRQVNLYRAYMSSFAMSHYGMTEPCLERIEPYASLLSKVVFGRSPPEKSEAMEKAAKTIARIEGPSGDGQLSHEELLIYFSSGRVKKKVLSRGGFYYNWHALLTQKQRVEIEEEALAVWTEDAFQYHDIDRNRIVTVGELAHSFLQWGVVQWRIGQVKKAGMHKSPKKQLQAIAKSEDDALRKYFCKDARNCQAADDVETYTQKLLKAGKKTVATKMSNIFGMFDESEKNEEQVTLIDRSTGVEERKSVRHEL